MSKLKLLADTFSNITLLEKKNSKDAEISSKCTLKSARIFSQRCYDDVDDKNRTERKIPQFCSLVFVMISKSVLNPSDMYKFKK